MNAYFFVFLFVFSIYEDEVRLFFVVLNLIYDISQKQLHKSVCWFLPVFYQTFIHLFN